MRCVARVFIVLFVCINVTIVTGQVCTNNQFQCGNGVCIDRSLRCDGSFDCTDFTDEINCDQGDPTKCPEGLQRCPNEQCMNTCPITTEQQETSTYTQTTGQIRVISTFKIFTSTPQTTEQAPVPTTKSPDNKGGLVLPIVLALVGVVVLVGLVIGILYWWRRSKGTS